MDTTFGPSVRSLMHGTLSTLSVFFDEDIFPEI